MSLENLPALNATLNALATCFIVAGFVQIKRGNKKAHIVCMVSALVISAAFLTSYLIYHYSHPTTKFAHEGWPKTVYFLILFTHIPLAAAVVPMVLMTVIPALRQRFDRHKRVARWTLPVWLYVSVTGVLVYLMLYVWFPG
jgi:uncharacterized membrane protein YozB (DUF420 family)